MDSLALFSAITIIQSATAVRVGSTLPTSLVTRTKNTMKSPDKQSPLLALARQKLGEITEAEEKMFNAVSAGTIADFGTDEDVGTNPADRTEWPQKRTVSGRCIVWLCTDSQALAMVTPKGIALTAAYVHGEVDLSYIMVSFPLYFAWCVFDRVFTVPSA